MAHDVAKAIVLEAQKVIDEARLHISIDLCKDRDFSEELDPQHTPCCNFYKVTLETCPFIGQFYFSLNKNKHLLYKNLEFRDYEKALYMFMYQHAMHALYASDLLDYEIIILSFWDEKCIGTDKIQFCLHTNFSENPSIEIESITNEILDKINEPLQLVFDSWKEKVKSL
jgi:hypothetical protein